MARRGHPSSFDLTAKYLLVKINAMKDESLLQALEDAASRLGIKLSYEDLLKGVVATHGGMFMLRGEKRIIIHKGLQVRDKIELLAELLASVDTEDVHLAPEVRDRIEQARLKAAPTEAQA